MKKVAALVGACLMLPMTAFSGPQWGPPVKILGYYVWDNGAAAITTSNNLNPSPGCTSAQYLIIESTQPNFKAIWAQVIAAHAADQTVSLYYDGCIGPSPKIRAIAVPNSW